MGVGGCVCVGVVWCVSVDVCRWVRCVGVGVIRGGDAVRGKRRRRGKIKWMKKTVFKELEIEQNGNKKRKKRKRR